MSDSVLAVIDLCIRECEELASLTCEVDGGAYNQGFEDGARECVRRLEDLRMWAQGKRPMSLSSRPNPFDRPHRK